MKLSRYHLLLACCFAAAAAILTLTSCGNADKTISYSAEQAQNTMLVCYFNNIRTVDRKFNRNISLVRIDNAPMAQGDYEKTDFPYSFWIADHEFIQHGGKCDVFNY